MPPMRGFSFWRWFAEATRVRNPYKVEVFVMLALSICPALIGLLFAFIAPALIPRLHVHAPQPGTAAPTPHRSH